MWDSSRLIWHYFICIINTSSQHFFTKSNNIRFKIISFKCPPLSSSSSSSLYFIHNKNNIIFFCNSSQFLIKKFRSIIISSFSLNCFYYTTSYRYIIFFYNFLSLTNTINIYLHICFYIFWQRIFINRKRSYRPIKSWNI